MWKQILCNSDGVWSPKRKTEERQGFSPKSTSRLQSRSSVIVECVAAWPDTLPEWYKCEKSTFDRLKSIQYGRDNSVADGYNF